MSLANFPWKARLSHENWNMLSHYIIREQKVKMGLQHDMVVQSCIEKDQLLVAIIWLSINLVYKSTISLIIIYKIEKLNDSVSPEYMKI